MRGRAKAMRSARTEAEHRLWQIVRAHRFNGFKFKRQVPIDDVRRDSYLQAQGFHIIRIWNNELFTNEEGVAEAILNALQSPLPNPSPAEGRGA